MVDVIDKTVFRCSVCNSIYEEEVRAKNCEVNFIKFKFKINELVSWIDNTSIRTGQICSREVIYDRGLEHHAALYVIKTDGRDKKFRVFESNLLSASVRI